MGTRTSILPDGEYHSVSTSTAKQRHQRYSCKNDGVLVLQTTPLFSGDPLHTAEIDAASSGLKHPASAITRSLFPRTQQPTSHPSIHPSRLLLSCCLPRKTTITSPQSVSVRKQSIAIASYVLATTLSGLCTPYYYNYYYYNYYHIIDQPVLSCAAPALSLSWLLILVVCKNTKGV